MSRAVLINGICDPAFKRVRTALEEDLAEGDEIGEVVAVVVNGKTVLDLWGGYKDRARTQPWERDTLVCMFSVGKPLAVLPVLMLADRGRIDLTQPVARYWPEFGQAGKDTIAVQQMLAQFAAIPSAFAAKKIGVRWDAGPCHSEAACRRISFPERSLAARRMTVTAGSC